MVICQILYRPMTFHSNQNPLKMSTQSDSFRVSQNVYTVMANYIKKILDFGRHMLLVPLNLFTLQVATNYIFSLCL